MKATFNTTEDVIEAAMERAGLSSNPSGDRLGYDANAISIVPMTKKVKPSLISVVGTTRGIMRLIGALADDSYDCLYSVD